MAMEINMSGGHFDYAQYWIEDIAAEIAQRVDWLVSEDDGEDSFMQRLGGGKSADLIRH